MTDITLIEGKLIHWEAGDTFTVRSKDGERFSFWFTPEVSPERTALIDAMFHRNTVKVIVQVEEEK